MDLKGTTIVVTRPSHQTTALTQLLMQQGAEVKPLPLMTIDDQHASLDKQKNKQCILDLDLYQHVIIVSANAARLAHELIDQYWPQMPQRINWLAVGEATAKVLQQYNYPVSAPDGGMNTESLLLLPELQDLTHQRVLICRGVGGREILAQALQTRGARVDYAELYHRTPCSYDAETLRQKLISPLPNAILISSGEGVENLTKQLEKLETTDFQSLQRTTLVVPSARVAELAGKLGYKTLCIAENATDQAMVSALASCATH